MSTIVIFFIFHLNHLLQCVQVLFDIDQVDLLTVLLNIVQQVIMQFSDYRGTSVALHDFAQRGQSAEVSID